MWIYFTDPRLRVPKQGNSQRGKFQGIGGHRLADCDCWDIDVLAELSVVIPVIV